MFDVFLNVARNDTMQSVLCDVCDTFIELVEDKDVRTLEKLQVITTTLLDFLLEIQKHSCLLFGELPVV